MYLNQDEIVAKFELLVERFPDQVTLEELPESTHEGRKMQLLRVKVGPKALRHGLYVQGNIHACEWGAADIVVHFVEFMLMCVNTQTNVVYGDNVFRHDDVRAALERVELFIVPCVNPDGRAYSTGAPEDGEYDRPLWRHNRRDHGDPQCIGVDLNRNFDWIWDYKTACHPDAWAENATASFCRGYINVTDDPCDSVQRYHGDKPFSEAETRNVRSVLDAHPHIRVFVDVHGRLGKVMTPWADDEVQSVDPEQNFTNPDYDGRRGLRDTPSVDPNCAGQAPHPDGGAYREYMHPVDAGRFGLYGALQRDAIKGVKGVEYATGTSYLEMYGMSGNANDYAWSRHVADPQRAKIDGYIYEYENVAEGSEYTYGFQPPYEDSPGPDDMIHIIGNVAAGLTELLLNVDRIPIVECTPAELAFGRVRIGAPETRAIRLANRGVQAFDVGPVALVGPAGPFSAGAPSQAHLEPGEEATIAVTAAPADTARSTGRVAIEFAYPGETVRDVRIVKCTARGCTVAEDACVAPTFRGTTSSLLCFWRAVLYATLIVALSLFAWLPSVRCTIRQLCFRIRNCREGNDNPCRTL